MILIILSEAIRCLGSQRLERCGKQFFLQATISFGFTTMLCHPLVDFEQFLRQPVIRRRRLRFRTHIRQQGVIKYF